MIVHPHGTTQNYTIGLEGRLSPIDAIASIVSVGIVPDAGGLSIGSFLVSGDGKGIVLENVAGGDSGDYYTITIIANTVQFKVIATAVTIAVVAVEAMARAVTALEMLRRIRERIRDENKHAVTQIPEGYTYGWESDDGNCLVSNRSLIEFLNDARDEYAKRSPFHDAQSSISKLAIEKDKISYSYDPRILAIRHINLDGDDTIPLTKTTEPYLDERKPGWRTDASQLIGGDLYYSEDAQRRVVTLGFLPIEDGMLSMDIDRLPLEKCSWENRHDIIIEPDQQYLEVLISWVEFKVYSIQDTELYDKSRGALGAQAFAAAIGPQFSARQLENKRNMSNMSLRLYSEMHWGRDARYGYGRSC